MIKLINSYRRVSVGSFSQSAGIMSLPVSYRVTGWLGLEGILEITELQPPDAGRETFQYGLYIGLI